MNHPSNPVRSRHRRALAALGTLFALGALWLTASGAFPWPWETRLGWPGSSGTPVAPLGHPTLEQRLRDLTPPATEGYRFLVFGDQRALADGEWQAMMRRIGEVAEADPRLLFMIDTGDIVQSGRHTDQFARLRSILAPAATLPYLVSVGNHETANNDAPEAREHTATFLSYLSPRFSPERMYYRKVVGGVRFLFLDTNDLVYGDHGDRDLDEPLHADTRGREQLEWLVGELDAEPGAYRSTVVVMHHPFLQTSERHRHQAKALWSQGIGGRLLADVLVEGDVDVVFVGHTHTYERFVLRRSDGRELAVVNVSGRPRNSVLWFGADSRRPVDIRGREEGWFARRGWTEMDRWTVHQADVMTGREANQYALIDVDPAGRLTMQVRFQSPAEPSEFYPAEPVRLN